MGISEHASLVRQSGEEACLLEAPRWDFNWQFLYIYDEPATFRAEDVLKLDCEYDSTRASETVVWGGGTGVWLEFVADKQ